ncbi:unnamed protein product [Spirodela intermedia]|uniref:Uncharacterized protein n=1 Tax=Spirodela intermedia TaxID=51605 RepID=A0A7I8K9P9_SPIIN|nr:unnamed protein product [Spirodela intermedia]
MSDLGQLCSYLGIEVAQEGARITLSQRAYALKILDIARMRECNPVHTLLEARIKFSQQNLGSSIDSTHFHSLIGSLRYLTHTRPDLIFSVGLLSRFMENPTSEHLSGIKWILRYVRETIDYDLVYEKGKTEAKLVNYSDSDFAGDEEDRKSTSRHAFFLGDMLISWASEAKISSSIFMLGRVYCCHYCRMSGRVAESIF